MRFEKNELTGDNPLNYKKMKNLFLRQSYLDSWEDYENSLRKPSFIKWDYIILTASNEEQARTYREQIDYRLAQGLLPAGTHYAVLPDPDGKRVGSGGATFHVLKYIAEKEQQESAANLFKNRRILVIHSGGDSKRVPQYSACGKLFSPVPRQLPNGYASTLFDEFIIGMSGVPSRIPEGMLILSGDVLLLFNPLQIDFNYHGAAAISMKENVLTGKDHGVFLNDGNDYVGQFLHKQSEERLRELGAVNGQDNVDLDTGAVIMDSDLLYALFSLISTDGRFDDDKFREFVNEEARISFYGDFLYPLARSSTLEQYYREAAEGTINDKLLACRRKIWEVLSPYSMKLLCLSPAEFIHFGTTTELRRLVTADVEDYEFLDWKKQVATTAPEQAPYAAHNSYVGKRARVSAGAYLEDSYILDETQIGQGSVISNVKLRNVSVPDHVVLHGLRLLDGRYVIRIYGVEDNPKGTLEKGAGFLGTSLPAFLEKNGLPAEDIWENGEHYLWFAALYPAADTMEEAIRLSLIVKRMADGAASPEEREEWKKADRKSLYSSFNEADVLAISRWQHELESRILASKFVWAIEGGSYYKDALGVFGAHGISSDIYEMLLEDAEKAAFSLKIRIYYALAQYMKEKRITFHGKGYDSLEAMCFGTIQHPVYKNKDNRQNDHSTAESGCQREGAVSRIPHVLPDTSQHRFPQQQGKQKTGKTACAAQYRIFYEINLFHAGNPDADGFHHSYLPVILFYLGQKGKTDTQQGDEHSQNTYQQKQTDHNAIRHGIDHFYKRIRDSRAVCGKARRRISIGKGGRVRALLQPEFYQILFLPQACRFLIITGIHQKTFGGGQHGIHLGITQKAGYTE